MKTLKVEFFEKEGEWFGQVTEQTHRGEAFGDPDRLNDWRFESRLFPGYQLSSESHPTVRKSVLWVRGHEVERDEAVFSVSPLDIPRWQAIIAEYNEYFKDTVEEKTEQAPPHESVRTSSPAAVKETLVLTLHKKYVNGGLLASLSKAFEDDNSFETYKWTVQGDEMCLVRLQQEIT